MTAVDKDNPKVTYEHGFLKISYNLLPVLERIIEIK